MDPEKEARLSQAQKLKLLREKVKYVFVLFQENRSFDFHFGTFPGAVGLYSQAPEKTPGFYQPFVDTQGKITTITPFKIPASVTDIAGKTVPLYPADTASVDHSHTGIDRKLDFDSKGVARNDRYSPDEEGVTIIDAKPSKIPSLEREQFGELVMAHIDCDTVPFLWNYADRFVLYDNFFDTVIGPSTPNAIAMIAGQSGETQWVKYPQLGNNITTTGGRPPGDWRSRPVLGIIARCLQRSATAGTGPHEQSCSKPYVRDLAPLLHGHGHSNHYSIRLQSGFRSRRCCRAISRRSPPTT
ncbi:MAG: hypothetical protein M3Y72_27150 [Acidobacteriota bacterium]|nr:hypothetical protein [Acidobacteriota bacterium]